MPRRWCWASITRVTPAQRDAPLALSGVPYEHTVALAISVKPIDRQNSPLGDKTIVPIRYYVWPEWPSPASGLSGVKLPDGQLAGLRHDC